MRDKDPRACQRLAARDLAARFARKLEAQLTGTVGRYVTALQSARYLAGVQSGNAQYEALRVVERVRAIGKSLAHGRPSLALRMVGEGQHGALQSAYTSCTPFQRRCLWWQARLRTERCEQRGEVETLRTLTLDAGLLQLRPQLLSGGRVGADTDDVHAEATETRRQASRGVRRVRRPSCHGLFQSADDISRRF